MRRYGFDIKTDKYIFARKEYTMKYIPIHSQCCLYEGETALVIGKGSVKKKSAT